MKLEKAMSNDLVSLITRIARGLEESDALPVPADLTAETPLFGRDGFLDSLGLVTLVVAVEQAIEDELGVTLSLADEKALSLSRSPYRTVGRLAEYAQQLLGETASRST
jgi:acyl carrier protein